MYIYGSECTVTLILPDTQTAHPYSFETLREETEEVPLDPLVGYMMPIACVPTGTGNPLVLEMVSSFPHSVERCFPIYWQNELLKNRNPNSKSN